MTKANTTSSLPERAWETVTWREGTRHKLKSRFAAVRVRPAHRDEKRSQPYPEEWLLMEWPSGETTAAGVRQRGRASKS